MDKCESGEATGEYCAGEAAETVDWMPMHLRASHQAAGKLGSLSAQRGVKAPRLQGAWEIWTRVERPDLLEYQGVVKGVPCKLWWDDQVGVDPGWCVRINAGVMHRECDIPVKGRKESKLATLHRNVLEALR